MGNVRNCRSCGCITKIYAGDLCKACYYQVYMRFYRGRNSEREREQELNCKEPDTREESFEQIPNDSSIMYEEKKNAILIEYQRFNRVKASDIAELAKILELIGHPTHRIVDKLLKDLSSDIAKTVILKAVPSKYLVAATMKRTKRSTKENIVELNSTTLTTLNDASDACKRLHMLLEHMINNLSKMPESLKHLDHDEEVIERTRDIDAACEEIRRVIDAIRESKAQDMRAFIDDLQRLCIHLLALAYSYRYIAKIFGMSTKWISKKAKESNIEKMPSINITLDRDVRKGEQIDILPYALGQYKINEDDEETQ